MGENRRTTYRISEAARDLGISAEWLRKGRLEASSLLPCVIATATATTQKKISSGCATGEVTVTRSPPVGSRLYTDGTHTRLLREERTPQQASRARKKITTIKTVYSSEAEALSPVRDFLASCIAALAQEERDAVFITAKDPYRFEKSRSVGAYTLGSCPPPLSRERGIPVRSGSPKRAMR
jgi:hypothetical protein